MSTKTKTVKKPSTHPVYKDMVISVMKGSGRKGKSRIAIIKEIKESFSINSPQHEVSTKQCLKRLVSEGKLIKAKGVGLSGSFKLSPSCLESEDKKKRKAASAKKAAAKKPTSASLATGPTVARKPAAPAKKPATSKKPSPKKPAPAKPKAKVTPKKKPTPNKAATKPAAKPKKPPTKKPKTPKKAAPKKK